MSLARTLGVALLGVRGAVVEIQADLSAGLPGLSFTGLADTSVVEARDRIRAAVGNSGVEWPNRKITVALLPADVRKVGSHFDLGIALSVLAAAGAVPVSAVAETLWMAELGLDGRLRPVRGVLPAVAAARAQGVHRAIVAPGNAGEAALVSDTSVRAARDLREIVEWLRGDGPAPPLSDPPAEDGAETPGPDLADVVGQSAAKRAVEIAAAGAHHLYLVGAPGAGKTMLAERLPGLLPTLDDAAALEVTSVHSVAGQLRERAFLVRRPPWQAPHHTASIAALVGGGARLARPGAISLAHRGILFLDEAPEFPARALDALRQPLEDGNVVLHRGGGAVTYPARFQLVLAANPCPCARPAAECQCSPHARRRYQQRLSGPLLDRVDLTVQVEPVAHADLFADDPRESSEVVAARVTAARDTAAQRWRGQAWGPTNATVPGAALRSGHWALPRAALSAAEQYLQRGQLSARGFDRVLRLSWTLADLAGRPVPGADEVAEALFFRSGDSGAWAA